MTCIGCEKHRIAPQESRRKRGRSRVAEASSASLERVDSHTQPGCSSLKKRGVHELAGSISGSWPGGSQGSSGEQSSWAGAEAPLTRASRSRSSERVCGRLRSSGYTRPRRFDLRGFPWGLARLEAFWVVSGDAPKPGSASAVLADQVN
jgi:hypothetical protein